MARPKKATAPDADARLAYRPDEAAQLLGLSRSTIIRLIRDGELEAVKVPVAGNSGLGPVPVIILKEALDAFLARNPWAEATV